MTINVIFTNPVTKSSYSIGLSLTKSFFLTHRSQSYWRCLDNTKCDDGLRYCVYCATLPYGSLTVCFRFKGNVIAGHYSDFNCFYDGRKMFFTESEINFSFAMVK